MPDNDKPKYSSPILIQMARPENVLTGESNLNDPRDFRDDDDDWIKYEDTDEEL